jgi:phage terminase small subunit
MVTSARRSVQKAAKSTAKAELTPKQEQFVAEYLIDLNGTQAAIRAGYSQKTANEQAARLLANVSVSKLISERRKEHQANTGITAERVLKEVAGLAFFDVRRLVNADGSPKSITDLDDETARAIQGIELQTVKDGENAFALVRKYKIADKNAALEKLMKHLGLFAKDNSQNNPAEAMAKLLDLVNGSKLPLAASK